MLEFVEGTLPPTLRTAVARHIEGCPSCMKVLEEQSSRTRALQKLGRVKAPDQWPEISRSIRKAGWMYFLRRYGLPAAIFGVTTAIVIVGLTAFVSGPKKGGVILKRSEDGRPIAVSQERTGKAAIAAAGIGARAQSNARITGKEAVAGIAAGANYGALEADHYGRLVGQLLEEGALLVVAEDNNE